MIDVKLKADGKTIHDLSIESGYDGERDKTNVLTAEGGVLFKTKAGKNLFLRYSEFSFHIPAAA